MASNKHGTCGAKRLYASDQAHPETDLKACAGFAGPIAVNREEAPQPITTWGRKRELSLVINESSSRMPMPEALPATTHDPIKL